MVERSRLDDAPSRCKLNIHYETSFKLKIKWSVSTCFKCKSEKSEIYDNDWIQNTKRFPVLLSAASNVSPVTTFFL